MKLKLSQWPAAGVTLYRTFGARGIILRARHEARVRAGRFRGQPTRDAVDAGGPPLFDIDSARFAGAEWSQSAVARAERVLAGEYEAFGQRWTALPATAAEWRRQPATGMTFPLSPWWQIPMLSPTLGDIKSVWEPARFGWGYDLMRGYLVTGDERYAEAFFGHLARWCESSPPFRGPHWACGQETAIRAVMLAYADSVFRPAGSATAGMALLHQVLAWSGERIRDAIGYAVSQRNNHAVSEAAGLVVVGLRLDGLHPEAAAWHQYGTGLLGRLIGEQFAADGWYIQHSFTYQRLALDQCIVAQRALARRGQSLPKAAVERLRAAGRLVGAVIDPASGEVPNYGANDGALVHPVSSAPVRDFRPVCTALAATFGFALPGGVRPDEETLAWLGASSPPRVPGTGDVLTTGVSGWAAATIGPFQLFFRAGRYRSRPGHLDPLHLDLRLAGEELIVDPGTYAYNAPAPWQNGLAGAAVHNGPMVDDREPGVRGPRFLWYLWPESELTVARLDGGRLTLCGEIHGRVRRTIEATSAEVVVTDLTLGDTPRSLAVSWLLRPGADPDSLEIEGGADVVQASEGSVAGWFSPTYGQRIASEAVVARREGQSSLTLTTRIRASRAGRGLRHPNDSEIQMSSNPAAGASA